MILPSMFINKQTNSHKLCFRRRTSGNFSKVFDFLIEINFIIFCISRDCRVAPSGSGLLAMTS